MKSALVVINIHKHFIFINYINFTFKMLMVLEYKTLGLLSLYSNLLFQDILNIYLFKINSLPHSYIYIKDFYCFHVQFLSLSILPLPLEVNKLPSCVDVLLLYDPMRCVSLPELRNPQAVRKDYLGSV